LIKSCNLIGWEEWYFPNSGISSVREWYFKITIATTIFDREKLTMRYKFFFWFQNIFFPQSILSKIKLNICLQMLFIKRCKEMCLWLKAHFENHKRQVHVKFSDKLEQRKHNSSIKITFIQHLTYIKVISIDDFFVYTTIGAFTNKQILITTCKTDFSRESFSDVICVSHLLSTNQRVRINLSFVNNDGAWSKLQNFIEPYYKQLIACFVHDIWH